MRWADESLKQLSFYNNLLLTLSVGFLSFSFNKYTFSNIHFFGAEVDWCLTFLLISTVSITVSIIAGLFVAINRLQDFRISRRISLIRYRVYKHSGILLSECTQDEYNFWKRLILVFHNYPTVTIEECKSCNKTENKKIENIKSKFIELRNISHNLGRTTWNYTVLQTVGFALGIALYLFRILSS